MVIAPQLLQLYPPLNPDQQTIISHEHGPLLVIAGPGSGKTRSLILRAMNLLLLDKARPEELVLCTYTEKAANEMRNRLMTLSKEVGYQGDLSQVRAGTIHGICNQIIMEYRHNTPLGNDYRVLDQFAQRLFILHHLNKIVRPLPLFQNKWGTNWEIAKRLQEYFDKIMEELVNIHDLRADNHHFQRYLADAYDMYGKLLMRENCVSFAALLKIVYTLLDRPEINHKIIQQLRYVFVDEYQDTNYIQEQIILKLASATGNLCVVGDEDQALYRFRGATVRNILEFPEHTNCTTIYLTTNYRSHADIVHRYDQWMASADWSNTGKTPFRFNKKIEPNPNRPYTDYPAVFAIQGKDIYDEAEQFADMVFTLKENGIVSDYSQIALLMYSVQQTHSGEYIKALIKRNIPFFCPRARAYFYQEEICLLLACFALLFNYRGEKQGDLLHHENFAEYIQKQCLARLNEMCNSAHPLKNLLHQFKTDLLDDSRTGEQHTLNRRPTDYFYQLLATEPFATFVQDEQRMRNLVIFSKILKTFQNFYRHSSVSQETLGQLRNDFFYVFLRLLEDGGINEYEDTEQPFLQGHVQIMTIHQAKGLEFSVVIVASLNAGHASAQIVDRDLQNFYKRKAFEPEKRIPCFDMMRLYYVAFSRAENLLVLTGNKHRPPKQYFSTMLDGLPHWPMIQGNLSQVPRSTPKKLPLLKHSYSFTKHIQMYETCPRQYQYFCEYNFVPSHQKDAFLGLLVHQTLEELHRIALAGQIGTLNEAELRRILERINACLLRTHEQPIDAHVKEQAFTQIYNYFQQNRKELRQIRAVEVDIAIEKDSYILTGRIDLLLERHGKLELLDFKTSPRPAPGADSLLNYERQLCIYAHALEKRYHQRPERLLLYWTGEQRRQDALMEIRYQPDMEQWVDHSINAAITSIKEKDFRIVTAPEPHICRTCDIQHFCARDGFLESSLTG